MDLFLPANQGNMRRVNFTQHEKILLLSLSYCPRDTRQLRKCWENLKTRYRKSSRQQMGAESTPTGESTDVDNTLENEMLFRRISLLVDTIDTRHSAYSAGEKRLSNSDTEQPLTSLVFGDSSNQLTSMSLSKHQKQSSSEDSNSLVKTEVPETEEKKGELSANNELGKEEQTTVWNSNEEDISIVEVSSGKLPIRPSSAIDDSERSGPESSAPVSTLTSTKKRKFGAYSLVKSGNEAFLASSLRTVNAKKHLLPLNSFYSNFKMSGHKQRPSSFVKTSFHQPRPQAVDTEKILRIRFLRNRIREQETRLRMMQQRMRHERERHEAMMTLLHKKSSHYEQQINRLQDQFNDDSDLCDDWLLSDP